MPTTTSYNPFEIVRNNVDADRAIDSGLPFSRATEDSTITALYLASATTEDLEEVLLLIADLLADSSAKSEDPENFRAFSRAGSSVRLALSSLRTRIS